MTKKNTFNRAIRILLTTNWIILLAAAMLGPIYALFVEEIWWSLLDASIAWATFALAAGIMTLISGKLSDRIKENKIIVVIWYLLIWLWFFLYIRVDSIIFLLIVQVLIWFGEALYSPAFDNEFSRNLDKGKAGRERGARESINYFATAIWAILWWFIVTQFWFSLLFLIISILCVGSAIYVLVLPKKVL